MKKFLARLFLISFLVALLFPIAALAVEPENDGLNGATDDMGEPPLDAICCKLETLAGIVIGKEGYYQCYFESTQEMLDIVWHMPEGVWQLECRKSGDPAYGWGVRTPGVVFGGCILKRTIIVDGVPWGPGLVLYEECPTCCLLNTIYNVTDIVFVVAMALAGVLIVLGGVMFLVSAGDPERTKLAKNIILFTVIGVAMILLARALISIIARIVVG